MSGFVNRAKGGHVRCPIKEQVMRLSAVIIAIPMLVAPLTIAPARAQRAYSDYHRNAADHYDRGYDDGEEDGYTRGYDDARDEGARDEGALTRVVHECKRRKGKGAVLGALAGGLIGHLSSDRNKLANTAIGAAGGGLLGDIAGKRGTDYDC